MAGRPTRAPRSSRISFMKSILLTASLLAVTLAAASAQDLEADKAALRELGARYEAAINAGNLAELKDHVLPDASAVFMTGEERTGLDAMQTYLNEVKAQLGKDTSYTVRLHPDETNFQGDIAIARGTSDESISTAKGDVLDWQTKWTAVLKKVNGRWLALRLHVSLNPLDNPIINLRSTAGKYLAGLVGVGVGLLLVKIVSLLRGKKAA